MVQRWNTRQGMQFTTGTKKGPAIGEAFQVHRKEGLAFLHFFKIHIGDFGIAVRRCTRISGCSGVSTTSSLLGCIHLLARGLEGGVQRFDA